MWKILWPILMVVASNTIYNICSKSTPREVNGFASLTVTYTVAAVCAAALFYVTGEQKSLAAEPGRTNWTAWVLGPAIVGLEFGFPRVYRAGWRIKAISPPALRCPVCCWRWGFCSTERP